MHSVVSSWIGTLAGSMLLALLFPFLSNLLPAIPTFIEQGKEAHLNTVVVSGDPAEKRFLIESVGGGLAVIDYNNDGWMQNTADESRRRPPDGDPGW